MKTILILAANPKNTSRLRLDQEVREIDNGLQRARRRDEFFLKQVWAVRRRDFRRAMLDLKPNIVHFCGHGSGKEGIAFEDENGLAKFMSVEALSGFFELFADAVECVVLNACYSEVQAKAIAEHIPHVIGMNKAIGDTAAIEFSVAFYDALGAGESIEFAYKLACNAIQLAGLPESLTPVLESGKRLTSEQSRTNIDEVVVNLLFNKDGLVIKDERELKASLAEALFAAENQSPVVFDVVLEPLEVVERHINSIESEEASPENRITKVNLQRQARILEAKHKAVTLALSLFLLPPLRHHFVSSEELIESLHGLARLSFDFQCDESASSLSLTIFRKDDPKLSTVIWIDETEQGQIKAQSESDSVFATLIGCDLFDLPRKTRFGKAIPAIIFTIAWEAIRTDQDIHNLFDLSKVLNLYSWSVGLH